LSRIQWWFVISDVVAALIDSMDPQGYVKDMRRRDPEIEKGWGQIAIPFPIVTAGRPQNLNCATAEGLFRLVQSIPRSGRKVVTRENYLGLTQVASKKLAKTSLQKPQNK
jgi:hypothetical protein